MRDFNYISIFTVILLLFFIASCKNERSKTVIPEGETEKSADSVVVETLESEFMLDSIPHKTYTAFNKNGKDLPVVIVIPEWWGLNEYPKSRARQLAEEGFYAVAVDVYGNGKIAQTPDEAQKLAMPFYTSFREVKSIMDKALVTARVAEQSSDTKAAAIGYCFGGSFVLNAAKMGSDLDGVVSFHGGLRTVSPQPGFSSKILVAHGKADNFVTPEEISEFRNELDSLGADYSFIEYENATHAFTNPEATEKGKKFDMPIEYNEAADKKSWNDMLAFFDSLWN